MDSIVYDGQPTKQFTMACRQFSQVPFKGSCLYYLPVIERRENLGREWARNVFHCTEFRCAKHNRQILRRLIRIPGSDSQATQADLRGPVRRRLG